MKKLFNALSIVLILSMIMTTSVFADNVVNDIVVGGTDTFTLGGSTLVGYKIVGNKSGGDDQAGCNADDGTSALVTIITPSGVTADPSSLTFTTCNDFQNVTFTAVAAGDYSITVSIADSGTGTYSLTPAAFTLHVLAPAGDINPPDYDCTVPDLTIWYAADVTVNCTASDSGSGLANPTNDASFTLSTSVPTGTETDDAQTGSKTIYDVAGNFVVVGPYSFKVDKKAPTNISFLNGEIVEGGQYYFGFVPAGPTSCTADDGGSGLDSCIVTGGGLTVGSKTFTATATDNVGNFGTKELHYTVLRWTLTGFYQPVDMDKLNTVKGGSTVPLKFEVFAGDFELTNPDVVFSLLYKQVACTDGTLIEDAIETLATGGTVLRYDPIAGQFVYNWQTPKKPGTCWVVTMTTDDGSSLSANFKLK